MKQRTPLAIFLIPIILLLVIVAIFQGNVKFNDDKESAEGSTDKEKTSIKEDIVDSEEDSPSLPEGLSFECRIPVYPNSMKAKLEEGASVTEAAFYGTPDSIDTVKQWYVNYLTPIIRPAEVDTTIDGNRTVTILMPDAPKELVEIKNADDGSGMIRITITTLEFYTRNQPRQYEPSQDGDEVTVDDVIGDKKDGENG